MKGGSTRDAARLEALVSRYYVDPAAALAQLRADYDRYGALGLARRLRDQPDLAGTLRPPVDRARRVLARNADWLTTALAGPAIGRDSTAYEQPGAAALVAGGDGARLLELLQAGRADLLTREIERAKEALRRTRRRQSRLEHARRVHADRRRALLAVLASLYVRPVDAGARLEALVREGGHAMTREVILRHPEALGRIRVIRAPGWRGWLGLRRPGKVTATVASLAESVRALEEATDALAASGSRRGRTAGESPFRVSERLRLRESELRASIARMEAQRSELDLGGARARWAEGVDSLSEEALHRIERALDGRGGAARKARELLRERTEGPRAEPGTL